MKISKPYYHVLVAGSRASWRYGLPLIGLYGLGLMCQMVSGKLHQIYGKIITPLILPLMWLQFSMVGWSVVTNFALLFVEREKKLDVLYRLWGILHQKTQQLNEQTQLLRTGIEVTHLQMEEIAYRPGYIGYHEAQSHFQTHLRK